MAGNQAVSMLLEASQPSVQRFETNEHKSMGDRGSGGIRIKLADDLTVSFGDITAMAGDYFGSVDQIRALAAVPGNTGRKAGSIDELKYALDVRVRRTKKDADFSPAVVNAVTRRFYTLAGSNITHFTNPDAGDASLSLAEKAGKRDHTRVSDKLRDASGLPSDYQTKGRPVNNAGSYRENHVMAIKEAVRAGKERRPLDDALLYEAFASHFLTDAYSSGHLRTPRAAISAWWNPRVPMFWHNLKLWMAESLAKHLNDNSVAGYVQTVQQFWEAAQQTLRDVLQTKGIPDLTFGDAVSGAVHDLDNERGVVARVGNDVVTLVGDGAVLDDTDRALVAGAATAKKAAAGVSVSLKDVHEAHAKGRKGQKPTRVVSSLQVAHGLFRAEQLWPKALPDADPRQTSKSLSWQVDTPEDLFRDPGMRAALTQFAHAKADTLGAEINLEPPFKADKELAMKEAVLAKLKADESTVIKVFRQIINYTPGSVSGELGGVLGHDEDDNALDYYRKAKSEKALGTLTIDQRKRLVHDVLSGVTVGEEESMILDLLKTNDSHIVPVVDHVSWRWVWKDLSGENCRAFIRYCGPIYWKAKTYEAKKLEVKWLADGRTSDTAQETILIILRTCSPAEVRRIDDEVGGWTGLSFDLTGRWDTEFKAMKASGTHR